MKKSLQPRGNFFSRISHLVFVCAVSLCLGTVLEAEAQYVRFSSSGTTSNFDSLYENFASKNKPKLNPSLYRSKTGDSIYQQLGKYRSKYNNAFDKSDRYRSRYDDQIREIKRYRDKYSTYKEKYGQASDKILSLSDQLLSGSLKLDSNTVFNNRIMQKYMDSLKRSLPAQPTPPFQEVSKEDLLKQVNEQFQGKTDSLRDSTDWVNRARKEREWVDLNYTRLKSADRSDIEPMVTTFVQTEILKHLDSLRLVDLEATRTNMEETQKNARERIAKFREKESFWKKSYLEGVLSMPANPNGTLQFSPAWAYHILPSWSLGGGPNVTINKESSKLKLDVGARLLTKYEMLHRMLYVQVEDRINPAAMGLEHNIFTQHNIMAGGGYVIPFLSPVTFNVAVMYKFYSNGVTENDGSSWIFRIGISTNKKKNE